MNDKEPGKSRGGRPRGFDREAAVETAMQLFWRHGYEGVSLGELTEAIGVAAPSLYAAFGSKAGLYREALARYADKSHVDWAAFDGAPSLVEAVRAMLRASARAVTKPGAAHGCMISSGMLACNDEHAELAQELTKRRLALREALAGHLQRWLDKKAAASTARYLSAVMQGLSVQARDGANVEDLYTIIDHAVRSLPPRRTRTAK